MRSNTYPTLFKNIDIKWKNKIYHIQYSRIDTTFQLIDAKNLSCSFPRNGIRCYRPYSAKHLDWYIDPKNMEPDQLYYSQKASGIAHWGKDIV